MSLSEEAAKIAAWSIFWEGSITIEKYTRNGHAYLRPLILLGNTNREVLQKFRDLVGVGGIYLNQTLRPDRKRNQPYYQWSIRAVPQCLSFIQEIRPYLPGKQSQADSLIEFCQERLGKGRAYTPTQIRAFQTIRRENRRFRLGLERESVFRVKYGFSDKRGTITNVLEMPIKHVALITSRAGAIRGNHFHKEETQYIYCVEGSFLTKSKDVRGKLPVVTQKVGSGDLVITPPYVAHQHQYLENTIVVNLNTAPRKKLEQEDTFHCDVTGTG